MNVSAATALARRLCNENHKPCASCPCYECDHDRTARGCENPHRCVEAAWRWLGKLVPMWVPGQRPYDGLTLTRRRKQHNAEQTNAAGRVTFDPSVSDDLPAANAFRIFTSPVNAQKTPVWRQPKPYAVPNEHVEVYTDGSCRRDATGAPAAGSGAWFNDGDPRNVAIRVPGPTQSNQATEIYAVTAALHKIPPYTTAHIVTDSKGWIGVKNAPLLQDLTARLRARNAPTTFRWVKGHSGIPGNEKADALACAGTEVARADPLPPPDIRFLRDGVKLTALTQRLAYRGIRAAKTPDVRRVTTSNLQRAVEDTKTVLAVTVTEAQIWKATRHQDISRRVWDFWWKLLHNAQHVGHFWMNIPGYEDHAICGFCGGTESMEHILMHCEAPGCAIVWELVLSTIETKCGIRLDLTYGVLLAAPATSLSGKLEKRNAGADRLAKILLTESAHLIWTLQCERVIQWAEEDGRTHAPDKITRMWTQRISKRIRMDQLSTSPRWQKKAIPPDRVLRTWAGVLRDENALPPDWIRVPGVLVGIPGPERHAGIG